MVFYLMYSCMKTTLQWKSDKQQYLSNGVLFNVLMHLPIASVGFE
jgi:hypothetical protein